MALIRALTSGVSGLRNFQSALDLIGNNISNVNTTGYKAQRMTFLDAISQTIRRDTSPTGTTGGTNPLQVGLGSNLSATDIIQTQGQLELTGRPTDMAVDGDGFFIINQNGKPRYTRDGSFMLDSNLNLVTAAGGFVQGWQADSLGNLNTAVPPANLTIPLGQMTLARQTTSVTMGGNLDANTQPFTVNPATPTIPATVRIYDSLGVAHDITLNMRKEEIDGLGNTRWHFEFAEADAAMSFDAAQPNDDGLGITDPPITSPLIPSGELVFNPSGQLMEVRTSAGVDATAPFTYSLALDFTNGASSAQTVSLDFSRMTQLAGENTSAVTNQDGVQLGTLFNFAVGRNGVITGFFTNGISQALGQVALATFANPGGLAKAGNNLFEESANSGSALVGVATSGGRGSVVGGSLEGSNVDLSEEFTRLIVSQRAFQANSRIITVSDDVLAELVALVRR